MRKGCPGVIRWVYIDALDLPRELLLQRFKGKEVIPKDKAIVKDIVVCDTVWSVIGFLRVFKKDARLQPRPVLLPNPCQFKFGGLPIH